MKKLALVAALAAVSTGAFAQSSVTLYGRVNTSIEYQDNDTNSVTVVRNNSSRWGMRGNEDLGGGLNAFFQLESGFSSDTGAGASALFGRDAYVGLRSSSLGTIKIGRISLGALYGNTIDYIGVFNHDTGTTSEDNIYALTVGFNNAVEYTSPSFGPVSFVLTAAAGERVTDKTYEGVINYDQGSLHLAAGYTKSEDPAGNDTAKGFAAAVSYGFGPFYVGVHYDNADLAGLGKRDSVTVTGSYTVGPSEFHISYGHAGEWDNVDNSDANQFTLGYNYNLSKRTKLYAFYFAVDNEVGTGGAIVYGGTGTAALTITPGDTFSSIGLGIRHNF